MGSGMAVDYRPSGPQTPPHAQLSLQQQIFLESRQMARKARPQTVPVKLTKKVVKHSEPPKIVVSGTGACFRIGKAVGSGGYSRCYLASAQGKVYAAKTITTSNLVSQNDLNQIKREIVIHRKLHHPSILKFIQHITTDSHIFLILDYCPNKTLHEIVTQRGRLREIDACSIIYQLALGVEYLHLNLVQHGDIKMSNILLDEHLRPKIADFGFAIQLKSPKDCRKNMCGTPLYMAPEVLREPCRFGLPADIWSLGVVSYSMLYGDGAFEATTVDNTYDRILSFDLKFPEVSPSITPDARYIISIMLLYDPKDRPTAKQLAKRTLLVNCFKSTATSVTKRSKICQMKNLILGFLD